MADAKKKKISVEIFDPEKEKRKMRVVVLASCLSQGKNLEYLVEGQNDYYEVSLAVFDGESEQIKPVMKWLEEKEIKFTCLDMAYRLKKLGMSEKDLQDACKIEKYMEKSRLTNTLTDHLAFNLIETSGEIYKKQEPHKSPFDLIVSTYHLWTLDSSLLTFYSKKIIALQPADLRLKNEKGERTYMGRNPVLRTINDAIAEKRDYVDMRTCVYLVEFAPGVINGSVEGWGEILVTSAPYRVDLRKENIDPAKIQTEMKEHCDKHALTTAVDLISRGRIALGKEGKDGLRTVYYIDDKGNERALGEEGLDLLHDKAD